MSKLMDIKVIPFEMNEEFIAHPETNELEYRFRGIGCVEETALFVTVDPEKEKVTKVEIYNPQVIGDPGTLQYPINIGYARILSDYKIMIKSYKKENNIRDDK